MFLAKLFTTQTLLIIFILSDSSSTSYADVGTAAQYSPPYLPTACYGSEASQFPSSNAGEGIWDNGTVCGKQYLVRCVSAEEPRTCVPDQNILVKIVDHAATVVSASSKNGITMVLSEQAFGSIADSCSSLVVIEFQEV